MSKAEEPRRYEEYEGEYLEINFDDDDCIRAIREELRGLTLAERMIFVMYSEEQTYSAVAKKLGCSVPTVSKRIKQIKNKLRSKIELPCTEL